MERTTQVEKYEDGFLVHYYENHFLITSRFYLNSYDGDDIDTQVWAEAGIFAELIRWSNNEELLNLIPWENPVADEEIYLCVAYPDGNLYSSFDEGDNYLTLQDALCTGLDVLNFDDPEAIITVVIK